MNENWWIFLGEGLTITILGSVLHFTYAWSKQNKVVAIFSAVNESTWEHIKLALSAILVCMLVDVWFLGDNPNYWLARSMSFLTPIVVIPIIFYGYQLFTKHSILPIDILTFVIAAFASAGVFVTILNWPPVGVAGDIVSMVLSVIMIAAYLLLTRFPLHNNFMFEDPITHRYGLEGHAVGKVKSLKRAPRGKKKQARR